MSSIFDEKTIFVKEKARFLKYGNVFDFFTLDNRKIGQAREEDIGIGKKIFKLTRFKSMLPFTISLYDSNEQKIVSLKRPFTFFRSKVDIYDAGGRKLGRFQ